MITKILIKPFNGTWVLINLLEKRPPFYKPPLLKMERNFIPSHVELRNFSVGFDILSTKGGRKNVTTTVA
jgi:hypothetical protein